MDRSKAPSASVGTDWGESYFARDALWDWHDKARIDILELDGRLRSTLDPWQTAVFHGADANHTVNEFLADLRRPYADRTAIPADLNETILKCLTCLAEDLRVIAFCDRPKDLPYYFDLPKREQDRERALQEMKEDGLVAEG
jgi:hypothetical protein